MTDTPLLKKVVISYCIKPTVVQIDREHNKAERATTIASIKDEVMRERLFHVLAACTGEKRFRRAAEFGVVGRSGREKTGQPLQIKTLGKFAYDRNTNTLTAEVTYNRSDGRPFVLDEAMLRQSLEFHYGEGAADGYRSNEHEHPLIKPTKTAPGYLVLFTLLKSTKFTFTPHEAPAEPKAKKAPRADPAASAKPTLSRQSATGADAAEPPAKRRRTTSSKV